MLVNLGLFFILVPSPVVLELMAPRFLHITSEFAF